MKNTIFITLLSLIPLFINAQNKSVKSFYNKYKHYENVSNVSLQGWVLNIAANFADEETEARLLKKITKLRVLIMEDGNLVTSKDYRSLINDLENDRFEQLMQVRDGSERIDFYIQDDGDTISNVIMLINGSDEFILVSLEGNLKFSDLKELNFEVEGGDNFKKIPKNKKDVPRA